MNHKERSLFENELKENKNLEQELKLQQDIDNSIQKELNVQSFKNKLSQIHQDSFKPKESTIRNLQNKWYWAAASITIFSGTATYTLINHLKSSDHLFNSFYTPYNPSIITRGAESENLSKIILKNFEDGNFIKVITLINDKYSTEEISPKLVLIKGCAEMEMGKFNEAIETFNLFNSKNYTLYTEAGQWYQALCYLKNKDEKKSKQLLKIIVDRNTSYAPEAKELIEKLN